MRKAPPQFGVDAAMVALTARVSACDQPVERGGESIQDARRAEYPNLSYSERARRILLLDVRVMKPYLESVQGFQPVQNPEACLAVGDYSE